MKNAEKAIIKKDIRGITSNKRLFIPLWIVPLMMTVVLPSIFICAVHFATDDPDVMSLLELLPESARTGNAELVIAGMIFNNILPAFFLMIPIMAASIMAASAFVGEKEKYTLETLLYCPLSVREIFRAKVLSSFLLSMFVSLVSFAVILLVVGQFAGVMLLNVWILLGLGVLCAALAWMLLQRAVRRFTYEMLLK